MARGLCPQKPYCYCVAAPFQPPPVFLSPRPSKSDDILTHLRSSIASGNISLFVPSVPWHRPWLSSVSWEVHCVLSAMVWSWLNCTLVSLALIHPVTANKHSFFGGKGFIATVGRGLNQLSFSHYLCGKVRLHGFRVQTLLEEKLSLRVREDQISTLSTSDSGSTKYIDLKLTCETSVLHFIQFTQQAHLGSYFFLC